MQRILQLSPEMINKIAAGEVIERPASIVKELVENSLDAGARRIEVAIDGGGLRRIQVSDDGHGIHRDDLLLAVTSHATSKVKTAEDLFRIGSLGFRGEALASIAAVSHLRVASRPKEAAGAELRIDGGHSRGVRAAGIPTGTTIEVADLFFNVPARRAFLRTERGELRAALAEIKRQALSRPSVSFRATADGQVIVDAPGTDEPRERIAQLLGRELAEDLLAVPRGESGGIRVRGYTTPTDRSRGDSKQQYFFLNGRAVRDVTLLTAVKQAYANLLPPRRNPSLLLWLDLDPQDVDVNVHPQKAEVRFRRDREVFRLVMSSLQRTLREAGLVGALRLSGAPTGAPGASPGTLRPAGDPGPASSATAVLPFPSTLRDVAASPHREATASSVPSAFLQVHRRYVLVEAEGGVRLVDPHAVHERILYEEILARIAQEPLESQRFLFPQIVQSSPEQLLAAEERGELLAQLGFEVAPFGRGSLAVHAAPRMLRAERVPDALHRLLNDEPSGLDPAEEGSGLLHDLAASLACRSAVRFGEALGEDQIAALLARMAGLRRGHCCPHGRPTALAISLDELDRRFGRQGARPPVDGAPRLL